MTRQDYYMYKQATGFGVSKESPYSLLAVLRKLFERKKKEQVPPEPMPEPRPEEYTPLPPDAWHGGGIGM